MTYDNKVEEMLLLLHNKYPDTPSLSSICSPSVDMDNLRKEIISDTVNNKPKMPYHISKHYRIKDTKQLMSSEKQSLGKMGGFWMIWTR